MDNSEVLSLLKTIGSRVPPASHLVLIGGSGLMLLGSTRPTIDIDFIGDDINPNGLHQQIIQIAKELKIHAEPVPLERFIPLPKGSEGRNIHIGKFGNLEIYVADPYSIALSKIDRGLETDIEDIIFLIQKGLIHLDQLEHILQDALPHANQFDFNPNILIHFQDLKNQLNK